MSGVTGNAKAGYSAEAVYKLRVINVDPHHGQQLQSDRRLHNSIVSYITAAARGLPQRLEKCYNAIYGQWVNEATVITDTITCIIGVSTGRVPDSAAAIADRVAAPNGRYDNPEGSEVPSGYD